MATTDARALWLVEITVYDPGLMGTRVLRYASGSGFVTAPGETPASTYYDARVTQPALIGRHCFAPGATQGPAQTSIGTLVLANGDGALDGLLAYGFDGQPVTIYQGIPGAAYPSGFTTVVRGTVDGTPEFGVSDITLTIRARERELDNPFQVTKYAGSNALPAGLEGVATDLKGKPKPVCLGQAFNIPAICVNTSKLIYQVHDGAIASIDALYDKGIPIGIGFPLVAQSNAFTGNVRGVAYGAGLFVAVGNNGELESSPDGVTWTARTSGFSTTQINAVAFGNGLFVAIGNAGKLSTSPDGITWTSRTSGFGASNILCVAYGNGLWVIGGQSGLLSTSPDAITWTSRTSGFSGSDNVNGLAYGNGLYLATGGGFSGVTLTTSPDGTTWTSRTSGFANAGQSIAFGRGRYVAFSQQGELTTSPDGLTWNTRPSGYSGVSVLGVAFADGLFVAVGNGGLIATSLDGTLWTAQTSGTANALTAIAFGAGVFVAVGFSGVTNTTQAQGAYSSLADLQDDTLKPAQGTFKAYLAGGYFRLGSTPAGAPTADVTQGATSADRTTAQLWKAVMTRAGKVSGTDYSAADLTTLDAAFADVCGVWISDETTFAAVLDLIAASGIAWWGADRTGIYRLKQLLAPTGSTVADYTANDLKQPLKRLAPADFGGIPVYSSIVNYAKNYTVQTTDLAIGVADARRAQLATTFLQATHTDTGVQTAHLLAQQTTEDTLLTAEADATTEAARRQALRGVQRDVFPLVVQMDSVNSAVDRGDVVSLTHPRFGLTSGKSFRVIGVEPDASNGQVALTVWG